MMTTTGSKLVVFERTILRKGGLLDHSLPSEDCGGTSSFIQMIQNSSSMTPGERRQWGA